MSELKRYLVLIVAFIAFILAAYIQSGGTWRGPHNLRKSLPAKGATIGMQRGRDGCYVCQLRRGAPRSSAAAIDKCLWLPHASSESTRSRAV
jgi:hypothetical protein